MPNQEGGELAQGGGFMIFHPSPPNPAFSILRRLPARGLKTEVAKSKGDGGACGNEAAKRTRAQPHQNSVKRFAGTGIHMVFMRFLFMVFVICITRP